MDNNKVFNIINSDIELMSAIIKKYTKEDINRLNSKYPICEMSNDSFKILNSTEYIIKQHLSLEENISIFYDLILEKSQVINSINFIINSNIKRYDIFLSGIVEKLKEEYPMLKSIKIENIKKSYDTYYFEINSYNQKRNLTIKNVDFYNSYNEIIENSIEKLREICSAYSRVFIADQLKKIGKVEYNTIFVEEPGNVTIRTRRYFKDVLVPLHVVHSKEEFNEVIDHVVKYEEIEEYSAYIINMKNRHALKFDEIQDIEFEVENYDKIKEFYLDLKQKIDKLNNFLYNYDLEKMENFKLFDIFSIEKYMDKKINDDHYSVYYFYKKNRLKKKILFKNGKRVGRTHYNNVLKLLKLNREIKICPDMIDIFYWSKISRTPLTPEQIDKYSSKLNWEVLSTYGHLNEAIILKYYNKLNWKEVFKKYHLSNNTLIQISNLIGWNEISEYAYMNKHFIIDNFNKFNLELLHKNKNLKFLNEILNILSV